VDRFKTQLTRRLKRTITDLLVIVVAVVGVTFLLKKGDEAGAGKATPTLPPSTHQITDPPPVRPRFIVGRVDNFKEAVIPKPIRSWDTKPRDAITLSVSPDPKLNRPSARVLLFPRTTSAMILEVQYTVPENTIQALSADDTIKARTDGVTVLVTTVGIAYNQSTFLKLDPLRIPEHRKWITCNLALPFGTTEVDFSIIGAPPDYNVFGDSCVISLPQLRVAPAK
jgi:hypothetical protein